MTRRSMVPAAMLVALLFSAVPARGAVITIPSLTVQPDAASFSLGIGISAVDDLFAFSFDVLFDPTVLALDGVQEGNFLVRGGTTAPCTVPSSEFECFSEVGRVSIGNSLGPDALTGVSDDGTADVLAFLTFSFIGLPVDTSISLESISLANSLFEEIAYDPTAPGLITVDSGVAAVPEPSTMMLMGIGLAGIARRAVRGRKGRPGTTA